jgi:hypothetical protein
MLGADVRVMEPCQRREADSMFFALKLSIALFGVSAAALPAVTGEKYRRQRIQDIESSHDDASSHKDGPNSAASVGVTPRRRA